MGALAYLVSENVLNCLCLVTDGRTPRNSLVTYGLLMVLLFASFQVPFSHVIYSVGVVY